jgi:S-adenosyl-L-methionine hydrolase (adenosine-forming)
VSPPLRYDLLTLLTDYGVGGPFVGAMHAVAFAIAPRLRVLDLDHTVPPQDVRRGAHRLAQLTDHVPPGVHVAVVDPGVGTARRPLAIETPGRVFAGPDNGLRLWAARRCGPLVRVIWLREEDYWRSPRSRTFDGRDVFVPVAAHVATGVPLTKLGAEVDPSTLVELPAPVVRTAADGEVEVEVLDVDRFGNVQLGVRPEAAAALGILRGRAVSISGTPVAYGEIFADVGAGGLLLYADSDGLLALAVNGGDASVVLALKPGDLVTLHVKQDPA